MPEVIWSELALKSYEANINYLRAEWSEAEIIAFEDATRNILINLLQHPRLGRKITIRSKLRRIVVHKRIILIYRAKSRKETIELVRFFNTWQKPARPGKIE